MTILFYSVSDRKNRLSKTLGTATSLSGTLREPVSLTDPEILIESATVPAYNYAYISDLGRYYFIVSVVAEQYSIYRLRMHVDVLMSYKGLKNGASSTGIYALNPYIDYQQAGMDYTPETRYPVTGTTELTVSSTATSTSWEGSSKLLDSTSTLKKYQFWINGNVYIGSPALYIDSPLPLAVLIGGYTEQNWLAQQLQRNVSASGSILEYVYKFGCLPVEISGTNIPAQYNLDFPGGFNQITLPGTTPGQSGFVMASHAGLRPKTVDFTVSITTPSTIRPQSNLPPFCRLSLVFRPFGKFELDPGLIFRNVVSTPTTVAVRVVVDPMSGTGSLYYGKTSPNIYLGSANLFISYPLAATTYSAAKVASGVLSVAGSVISAVATQGATALSIPGSLINAVSASIPNTSVSGGEEFVIDEGPHIEVYKKTTEDFSDGQFGRPYFARNTIYSISGYTQVGKVEIEGTGFGSMLDSERTELENIMKGGFYA